MSAPLAVPPEYGAPALVPGPPSLELAGPWRYVVGARPARAVTRPQLDDSRWATTPVPGTLRVTAPGKETTLWLRRRFTLPAGVDPTTLALDLGQRPGRTTVWLDGVRLGGTTRNNVPLFFPPPLPLATAPGEHLLALEVAFGRHVGGLRWSGAAALGRPTTRQHGLVRREFRSEIDGSTQEIAVFIPREAPGSAPLPLVVALPGWNGNIWSFSHSRLLQQAEQRGWLVLVPDPRGNVLYTGHAERGVLEAIERVAQELPVDRERIYLTGVSMGGAGALQVGYHYPDRFAAIAAFYGDSLYDMASYTGAILGSPAQGDRYSVLRFPGNARNTPVLLIHARDDAVSPFAQSRQLAEADQALGLTNHRLIDPPRGGHTLQTMEDHVDAVAELFARSVRPACPARVELRSNDPDYQSAWWLRLALRRAGQFGRADLEWQPAPGSAPAAAAQAPPPSPGAAPASPGSSPVLIVRQLDGGLAWGRVDLAALGLAAVPELTLVIPGPGPTAAPLRLAGRAQAAAPARLLAAGEALTDAAPLARTADGELELLPPLAAGHYRLVFGER